MIKKESLFLVLCLGATSSCSTDLNTNQIFVSQRQKNGYESLIDQADYAYNKGNFHKALELASQAEQISGPSEDTVIIKGYSYLSLSGMDQFNILRALTKSSDSATIGSGNRDGASILFDKLATILDINFTKLSALGEVSTNDDLELFKNYPVINPYEPQLIRQKNENPATPEDKIEFSALYYSSLAIKTVCPFIPADLKVTAESDDRHSCAETQTNSTRSSLTQFLWAFSHLAEAVVYYNTLMVKNDSNSLPNIVVRSNALKEKQASLSLTEYTGYVLSLAETIESVLSVSPSSMLNVIVNNLQIASKSLAKIGNLPKSVTTGIESASGSINNLKEEVSGASEQQKNLNAFKNQITKNITSDLSKQLDTLKTQNPSGFAENKDELCAAYSKISGLPATSNDACKS